jgi:hypothetical protein
MRSATLRISSNASLMVLSHIVSFDMSPLAMAHGMNFVCCFPCWSIIKSSKRVGPLIFRSSTRRACNFPFVCVSLSRWKYSPVLQGFQEQQSRFGPIFGFFFCADSRLCCSCKTNISGRQWHMYIPGLLDMFGIVWKIPSVMLSVLCLFGVGVLPFRLLVLLHLLRRQLRPLKMKKININSKFI